MLRGPDPRHSAAGFPEFRQRPHHCDCAIRRSARSLVTTARIESRKLVLKLRETAGEKRSSVLEASATGYAAPPCRSPRGPASPAPRHPRRVHASDHRRCHPPRPAVGAQSPSTSPVPTPCAAASSHPRRASARGLSPSAQFELPETPSGRSLPKEPGPKPNYRLCLPCT